MIEAFATHKCFHLAIAPEGTRSWVSRWKKGFYHIASGVIVPIEFAYIDYEKKQIGIRSYFILQLIFLLTCMKFSNFIKNIFSRYPEKFNSVYFLKKIESGEFF